MPCTNGAVCPSVQGESKAPQRDYHELNVYQPKTIYRPTNKDELVSAVIAIEADGLKGKAKGSNMSFSSATVTDDCLIETDNINRHLSLPYGAPNTQWAAERFRGDAADRLAPMMAEQVKIKRPKLLYVEAGIKIRQLLLDLNGTNPRLALPAMGASGRQSLAGALATGTHMADLDRPPLADAVRAVHLIGPGGREWWIERSVGFTEPDLVAASVPGWCEDTRLIYDDRVFYSAIVSVGRLGVIYAMVLEVEPEYWLEERRMKEPYSQLRETLEESSLIGFGSTDDGGYMPARGVPGLMSFGYVLNINTLDHCWVLERSKLHREPADVATTENNSAVNGICRLAPGLSEGVAAAINISTVAGPGLALCTDVMDKVLEAVDGQPPLIRGSSSEVMDQTDYNAPTDCYQGDQIEVFFNARSTRYLEYIDELVAAAQGLGGVPGYLYVRFMHQSDAYLAMEQFPTTVAVEVVVLRGSFALKPLLTLASQQAAALGAIPHWGKSFFIPRSNDVFTSKELECFHFSIALTQDGYSNTFSNQFTRDSGLETPAQIDDLNRETSRGRVSLSELFAAAQARLAMPRRPRSLVDVARQFPPSLRMNVDSIQLPRGKAIKNGPRVRLRDLSRRLM